MTGLWKKIKNYQGYEVSSLGNVKSFKKNKNGKLMALPLDVDGYCRLSLYSDNMPRMQKVHRLVAKAFIPNPENLPCVNHINGIKTDNRVENLEWCSVAYNNRHAIYTGLNKNYSENHHNAKFTEKQVKYIREKYSKGNTINELSDKFNCAIATMASIVKNESYIDVNYLYKNKDIDLCLGETHHGAKLTEKQVLDIRYRYLNENTSYRKLAAEYGLDKSTIGLIITRKLWKHI